MKYSFFLLVFFQLKFGKSQTNSTSYLKSSNSIIDTCALIQTRNANLTVTNGYFICYFYTNGIKDYNYNLIFLPTFEISDSILHKIISQSKTYKRKSKKSYFFNNNVDTYLLPANYLSEFENVFNFAWVIKDMGYMGEFEYLEKMNKYHRVNHVEVFSQAAHFDFQPNEIKDSMAIVFKFMPIKATLQLDAYNICTRNNCFRIYNSWSDSMKDEKYLYCPTKTRIAKRDDRIISPVIVDLVDLDFNDKRHQKLMQHKYYDEKKRERVLFLQRYKDEEMRQRSHILDNGK